MVKADLEKGGWVHSGGPAPVCRLAQPNAAGQLQVDAEG